MLKNKNNFEIINSVFFSLLGQELFRSPLYLNCTESHPKLTQEISHFSKQCKTWFITVPLAVRCEGKALAFGLLRYLARIPLWVLTL